MTLIIRSRDFNNNIHYLKGWDKKTPVWITESQYKNGASVQEYTSMYRVKQLVDRIREDEVKWKSIVVIELH